MPFLDRITSFAQNAADSTKNMLEMNKLNSAISAERAKISELKGKVGDYYWTRYASGTALDDEPAGICAEIKTCEEKIASIEAEIQTRRDETQRAAESAKAAQAAQSASNDQSRAQANTIVCPACGAMNPAASKFCRECGGKLETPAVEKPRLCSACGAENEPGTKFCSSCGNRLDV